MRKSYPKAAELLVAMAQTLSLGGYAERAKGLVKEFRNVRFNRHSAFKREVDSYLETARLESLSR